MADINSISQWFTKYENLLTSSGLSTKDDLSSHPWNCDKTGFCIVIASCLYCVEEEQNLYMKQVEEVENITVLG